MDGGFLPVYFKLDRTQERREIQSLRVGRNAPGSRMAACFGLCQPHYKTRTGRTGGSHRTLGPCGLT